MIRDLRRFCQALSSLTSSVRSRIKSGNLERPVQIVRSEANSFRRAEIDHDGVGVRAPGIAQGVLAIAAIAESFARFDGCRHVFDLDLQRPGNDGEVLHRAVGVGRRFQHAARLRAKVIGLRPRNRVNG